MAPTNTDGCKKNIAEATGLMGPGACATTVIQWAFRKGCYANKSADPRVSLPLEQLKAWMGIWTRSNPAAKKRIAKSWSKLHRRVALAKSRWQMVRGPASATIAILLDLGWKPVRPNRWILPDGSQSATFDSIHGVTQHQVLHALETALQRRLWTHASEAFCGSGLEHGSPYLDPAARAHKDLVKQGRLKEAKALECIVTNKSWCGQRILLNGGSDDPRVMCPRCNGYVESPFHRYYTCAKNRDILHKNVSDTQHLATQWQATSEPRATYANGSGQFCHATSSARQWAG